MLFYNNDLVWFKLKFIGYKLVKIIVKLFKTITIFIPLNRLFLITNYIYNKIRNRFTQNYVN